MSYFPELDALSLEQLSKLFDTEGVVQGFPSSCDPLWLPEIAAKIAGFGEAGLAYLLDRAKSANSCQARAIAMGTAFASPQSIALHEVEIADALRTWLRRDDPQLAAEAIDNAWHLGLKEFLNDVLPLVKSEHPFLANSAVRYIARVHPERALPILLDKLRSAEAVVRENAIDELDRLGCCKAVPDIRNLLQDEDADVREAAQTAIDNLSIIHQ